MSASYTFAGAMTKGDQLWLSRVLTTKTAKQLREIKEELAAVQSLYNRSFISIHQLDRLQHTIVTKTASEKPVIQTRSVRSVVELKKLHMNNFFKSHESKPVTDTGVCSTIGELRQKYCDHTTRVSIVTSKPIVCAPAYTVAKLAQDICQRQASAGQLLEKHQASIQTHSLRTVSELTHDIRNKVSTPTIITDKPAIITHSANTVAQMVGCMKAIKNKPASQSRPDIFTHAAHPVLYLKDNFLKRSSVHTVERPTINTRSSRSVTEVTQQLLSAASSRPAKHEKIIRITGQVADRRTHFQSFIKDRAL